MILELVSKGYVHWSDLHKKVLSSRQVSATHATFASQLRYLLSKSFITKESRGIYQITEPGKKYLEIM
jgi:hypothetical protein